MTFKRKEPENENTDNTDRNLDAAAPLVNAPAANAGAINTDKVTNIKSAGTNLPCDTEQREEMAKGESNPVKTPPSSTTPIPAPQSAFEVSQRALEKQQQQDSVLNLPEEVRKNIIGFEDMEMDEMLTRILTAYTAAISCDRIMQLLWTTYQRAPDRAKVLTRLRHMAKHKQIVKGEGRSMFQAIHPKLEGSAQA